MTDEKILKKKDIKPSDIKANIFASTSVFFSKNLPRANGMKKYKDVVDFIACTSNIKNSIYGLGVICLNYDLSLEKVEHKFYGKADYMK